MDPMAEDSVIACVDLVGRTGATDFQIGYLHDDVPMEQAGWYASASFRGARITVENQTHPVLAAEGLSLRLLTGAMCRCRRLGFLVVPLPPSAKMLREHANVCESQHLASDVHGSTDGCVRWMRRVASLIRDVR